jgi:hypothetical protein
MDCNLAVFIHGARGDPASRPPPMSLRRALEVAADVAAGLFFLHPTIVHRWGRRGRAAAAPSSAPGRAPWRLAHALPSRRLSLPACHEPRRPAAPLTRATTHPFCASPAPPPSPPPPRDLKPQNILLNAAGVAKIAE